MDLAVNFSTAAGVEAAVTAMTGDNKAGRRAAAQWRMENKLAEIINSMG